ncbi:MAG TPA: sensor histidine kinase [Nocardioidaceae bacterium]
MRSRKSAPLHVRLVLVNGVVFALGVLAMSLAPADRRGPATVAVLGVGLALIVAVNTRHLRRSLAPLVASVGALRSRSEREYRAHRARSLASTEYDGQRMAAELHDNVGDNLSQALVGLKRAIHHAPPELAAELEVVQHNARLSLVEMRKISRRLRPELLEDLGLQSAVAALVSSLSARVPSLKVRRRFEGRFAGIDDETELVVFRVAEEALTNVERHANARHVEVALTRQGDDVVLRVTDDGVGVGASEERTGILGMRERAALVGGRLSVVPLAGKGTEVRLDVPVRPPAR